MDLVQLICPVCRGKLTPTLDSMKCEECKEIYAVQDGIPVLLPPSLDDFSLEEAKYHSEFEEDPVDVHQLNSVRNQYYHDLLRKKVISNGAGVILEVGGGSGQDAVAILNAGMNLVETDISIGALTRSQKEMVSGSSNGNPKNVQFVCCTLTSLPFPDQSFETSFAIATIHHLKDVMKGILEMARVTKRGGTVTVGIEPNAIYFRQIKRFRKVLCFLSHTDPKKVSKADAEMSGFTERELQDAFEHAGLNVEQVIPVWLTLGPLHYGLEFVFRVFRLKKRIRVPKMFEHALLGIDRAIFALPFMKYLCWHWIISGLKR